MRRILAALVNKCVKRRPPERYQCKQQQNQVACIVEELVQGVHAPLLCLCYSGWDPASQKTFGNCIMSGPFHHDLSSPCRAGAAGMKCAGTPDSRRTWRIGAFE